MDEGTIGLVKKSYRPPQLQIDLLPKILTLPRAVYQRQDCLGVVQFEKVSDSPSKLAPLIAELVSDSFPDRPSVQHNVNGCVVVDRQRLRSVRLGRKIPFLRHRLRRSAGFLRRACGLAQEGIGL